MHSKAASPASSTSASPAASASPQPVPAPPLANVDAKTMPSEQTPQRGTGPSLIELAVRRQHLQEMRLGHINFK